MTVKLYITDDHSNIYPLLSEKNNITLLHIDAHSDLRGLVLDNEKAYDCRLIKKIDDGNFLTELARNEKINSVIWIRDDDFDRCDDIGTFKYMRELNYLKRKISLIISKEIKNISIKEIVFSKIFSETNDSYDYVSIDWDCIFNEEDRTEYSLEKMNDLIEFLSGIEYKEIYLAYSYYYSKDSIEYFNKFIDKIKYDELIYLDEINNKRWFIKKIRKWIRKILKG